MPDSVNGEGRHEYNYSLCLEQDLCKIPQTVKQLISPPEYVKKFNEEKGTENYSLFGVSKGMVITACSLRCNNTYMLRLYNIKDESVKFNITSSKQIKTITKVNLLDEIIDEGLEADSMVSGPREIITLLIITV